MQSSKLNPSPKQLPVYTTLVYPYPIHIYTQFSSTSSSPLKLWGEILSFTKLAVKGYYLAYTHSLLCPTYRVPPRIHTFSLVFHLQGTTSHTHILSCVPLTWKLPIKWYGPPYGASARAIVPAICTSIWCTNNAHCAAVAVAVAVAVVAVELASGSGEENMAARSSDCHPRFPSPPLAKS